jgi:hypothetical protein
MAGMLLHRGDFLIDLCPRKVLDMISVMASMIGIIAAPWWARGCLFGLIVSVHFDSDFQYRRKPSILYPSSSRARLSSRRP